MEFEATATGKNQHGQPKKIVKTVNQATANRIMHDAVRAVYGWGEDGTIRCIEANPANFDITYNNGNTLAIKAIN